MRRCPTPPATRLLPLPLQRPLPLPLRLPAAAPAAPTAHADRPAGAYVLATPYAKKLAKEKGYDLSLIPGTGPNGTVVAKDVESFVARSQDQPHGRQAGPPSWAWTSASWTSTAA